MFAQVNRNRRYANNSVTGLHVNNKSIREALVTVARSLINLKSLQQLSLLKGKAGQYTGARNLI